jgi:antitoxin Phd
MREIRMSGSMSGDWKRKCINDLNAPVLDSTLAPGLESSAWMTQNTKNWLVQDAKARRSEFLETCVREGPRVVTRRGEQTAVRVPIKEWRRVCELARPSLKALLLADFARTNLKLPAQGGHPRRRVPPL